MSLLTLFGGTVTQPLSDTGAIVPGGKLTFYATGTSDLKDVFHDAQGDVVWDQPVELDGNGRAVIFLDNDGAYDILFTDADDAEIWTLTAVIAAAPAV